MCNRRYLFVDTSQYNTEKTTFSHGFLLMLKLVSAADLNWMVQALVWFFLAK